MLDEYDERHSCDATTPANDHDSVPTRPPVTKDECWKAFWRHAGPVLYDAYAAAIVRDGKPPTCT